MSYRSRRSSKRIARKTRTNLIITVLLIGFLLYATLQWILPTLITGIGFVKGVVKPSEKKITSVSENSSLAPPVFNIPFEATSTAQINISGFGTPDSRVKLVIDDEERETQDVSSDGSFIFQNVDLTLGNNNIYGKSIDEENKESLPSKTILVVYDNEKPGLDVSEPNDGKTIQGGDRKVKIAGKTEVGIQVQINGGQVIIDHDGNFSSDQPLNDGDNNFTIVATDPAGNATEIQRKVIYSP